MTLTRIAHNPTLKGHKLLILSPYPASQAYIDGLRAKFPDLKIVTDTKHFADSDPHGGDLDKEWKDVTVLNTGSTIPDVGQAPKLEFVQLVSAGANHIVNRPLYKDTDVAFCTANGVHGYESRRI